MSMKHILCEEEQEQKKIETNSKELLNLDGSPAWRDWISYGEKMY